MVPKNWPNDLWFSDRFSQNYSPKFRVLSRSSVRSKPPWIVSLLSHLSSVLSVPRYIIIYSVLRFSSLQMNKRQYELMVKVSTTVAIVSVICIVLILVASQIRSLSQESWKRRRERASGDRDLNFVFAWCHLFSSCFRKMFENELKCFRPVVP